MPPTSESTGSFATRDAVSLLQELAADSFSGSVRAEHDGVVKVLYLAEGRLACSSSTHPGDRLGSLLQREGRITADQLEMAQEKALPGEALGSVLVTLGFIGPVDLLWGARRQVEQVLSSLMTWQEGAYRVRTGPLPDRAVNLKLELGPVVLAAARCLESRDEVLALLGPMDQVLEAHETPGDKLDEESSEVLGLLDGSRDLRGVCGEARLEEFEAAKLIVGLRALGLLTKRSEPPGAPPAVPSQSEPEPRVPEPALTEEPEDLLGLEGDLTGLDLDEEPTPARPPEESQPSAEDPPPFPLVRWLGGGAVVVLGLAGVYLLLGLMGGEEPQALDTTAAAPTRPAEIQDPKADPEGSADPQTPSGGEPSVDPPPPPAPGTEPVPTALEPVAKPDGGARLAGRSATQSGLEAYRAGDLPTAADRWRQELLAKSPGTFSLQVLAACEEKTLRRLQERIQPSPSLFLVSAEMGGLMCYRVLWGTYPDREAASRAIASVPSYFLDGGDRPWPVPLSSLAR